MFSKGRLIAAFVFVIILTIAIGGPQREPGMIMAQSAAVSCAALGTDPTYGIVGNPTVVSFSAAIVTRAQPFPGGPFLSVPPFCQVDLVISERGGPEFGYAPGEKQNVTIRIGLPPSTADGGTGGSSGQGAWNGKVRNVGGGGNAGRGTDRSPSRTIFIS